MTALCGFGLGFFNNSSHLRINLSSSLPKTLFLSTPFHPPYQLGQIVSIEHPVLNKTVGKIIAGKPGDQISFFYDTIYVNDTEIGRIQTVSKSGKFYHPISEGKISEDHYFVYTPHPESFDSRYEEFGLIKTEWIKEVLCPLL